MIKDCTCGPYNCLDSCQILRWKARSNNVQFNIFFFTCNVKRWNIKLCACFRVEAVFFLNEVEFIFWHWNQSEKWEMPATRWSNLSKCVCKLSSLFVKDMPSSSFQQVNDSRETLNCLIWNIPKKEMHLDRKHVLWL